MSASPSDEVEIVANGLQWGGWQTVAISRGVEVVPASYRLSGTERFPLDRSKITIPLTAPVTLKIGDDTIITGYLDSVEREVTPESHEVRLTGRSKLSDLTEATGFTKQWQLVNLTLLTIAREICSQFGITVSAPDGDTAPIPNLSVVLTESGFELLEELARWTGKLLYDDVYGNLVIADLSDNAHGSGIQEGVNALQFKVALDAQDVFTSIGAIYNDTATLTDGAGSTVISYVQNAQANGSKFFLPRADGSARYRPLLIVAEQSNGSSNLVPRRVQWEMARRIARAQIIYVTVDSWRDSGGNLWTPNWLITVSLPSIKIAALTLVIAAVTYVRDDNGTRAELTLMDPLGLAPMPAAPLGFDPASDEASSPTGAQPDATSTGSN